MRWRESRAALACDVRCSAPCCAQTRGGGERRRACARRNAVDAHLRLRVKVTRVRGRRAAVVQQVPVLRDEHALLPLLAGGPVEETGTCCLRFESCLPPRRARSGAAPETSVYACTHLDIGSFHKKPARWWRERMSTEPRSGDSIFAVALWLAWNAAAHAQRRYEALYENQWGAAVILIDTNGSASAWGRGVRRFAARAERE